MISAAPRECRTDGLVRDETVHSLASRRNNDDPIRLGELPSAARSENRVHATKTARTLAATYHSLILPTVTPVPRERLEIGVQKQRMGRLVLLCDSESLWHASMP
ncbi:hypothetical protein LCGC14_2259510 [marine sediment metagenome]|uniref:Uncharacterized protein n=1 Tax=marine sediment metagenome TaxID=412755 RepID=A0A0F9D0G7_9ZZZZ